MSTADQVTARLTLSYADMPVPGNIIGKLDAIETMAAVVSARNVASISAYVEQFDIVYQVMFWRSVARSGAVAITVPEFTKWAADNADCLL